MTFKPKFAQSIGGFSLIEVLISLLIMAMASVGLFHLQVYTLNSVDMAKQSQKALYLAENQLETLRHYSKMSSENHALFSEIKNGQRGELTPTKTELTWQVIDIKHAGEVTGKVVNVVAQWIDSNGQTKHISLKTVLAKPRLSQHKNSK